MYDIGTSFLINGYVTGHIPKDLLSAFEGVYVPDCNTDPDYVFPESVTNILQPIDNWLRENYLNQLFNNYTLHSMGLWAGVDNGSAVWHNDWTDGDPFNTNVLVYLDPPLENYIAVRNNNDPESETIIRPEIGQFVWVNQQKHIQHRAQHTGGPRRLLSFEYYVPTLT